MKVSKKKKIINHRFNGRSKSFHWNYCTGCGLVALKNERTKKAMKKPCDIDEE